MIVHVVSMSGGKDSTATALLAIVLYGVENCIFVFADTGHEHPITYDYLDYLENRLGIVIVRLRADFTERIANKRRYIQEHWPAEGIDPEIIAGALEVLRPTGIPFLDLCLWKGRFPSRRAQFCTTELKTNLLVEYQLDIAEAGHVVWSWQGVRRDESLNRRYLPEFEEIGAGLCIYRPIARWPAAATFEAMAYMGVKSNPLYRMGMSRVGCMPCINESKDGIAEIDKRWSWVIDKIDRWERLVSRASKRGASTFFHKGPGEAPGQATPQDIFAIANIRQVVEWSKTAYGGRQYDLLKAGEALACSSSYGLCE